MTPNEQKLPVELLNRLLRYDPESGKLFWLERTPDLHSNQGNGARDNCAQWNKRHAGKEAFNTDRGRGYKFGSIFNTPFHSHRVAWALSHGEWPPNQIDHINGVRGDNRLANLRSVTGAENNKNMARPSHNTTGVLGVQYIKDRNRWRADIRVGGKVHFLGTFKTLDEAATARKDAEQLYGFSVNHGRIVSPTTQPEDKS